MASLRLGCDLCHIGAIEEMLRGNERELARLFHHDEREEATRRPHPAQHLAGVFAAKEALAKAVGDPGLLGAYYQDVVVRHREDGAPSLHLSASLANTMAHAGLELVTVSISHDGEYAMATVLVAQNHGADVVPQRDPAARRCAQCHLSLEHLCAQGIADVLVKAEGPDGGLRYLCPVCLRGW